MLVIAHRLSTIRDADMIAVVANGAVAEVSTGLRCLHLFAEKDSLHAVNAGVNNKSYFLTPTIVFVFVWFS